MSKPGYKFHTMLASVSRSEFKLVCFIFLGVSFFLHILARAQLDVIADIVCWRPESLLVSGLAVPYCARPRILSGCRVFLPLPLFRCIRYSTFYMMSYHPTERPPRRLQVFFSYAWRAESTVFFRLWMSVCLIATALLRMYSTRSWTLPPVLSLAAEEFSFIWHTCHNLLLAWMCDCCDVYR